MKFIFEAKDEQGSVKKGTVEAISKEGAIQVLNSSKLIPLSIEQDVDKKDFLKSIEKIWEGVSQRELAVMFRQLATLIDAKVSIVAALEAISEQTENKFLQIVLEETINDVKDGLPLSDALAKHEGVFDPLVVHMVRAGEVSGNLQRSVIFLADNTEKNYELNAKIKSALSYPGFVLGAALIIGFIVFTVVLPKLTAVFADMKVEIPWYTAVLMAIGAFMSSYWWAVLIVMGGSIFGVIYYIKTESGRIEWDHIKLRLPVMGNLFRYVYISRFAENLGVLLSGGIPIVRALTIVSDVVGNSQYRNTILRAAEEVKTGGAMSNVFARSSEFPPIVSRMIKIGEEAGKISDVLKNVAGFYDREADRITRNLASLMEPVLIVFLGVGVAIIVFAVLVPIYNMTGSIGN